MNGAIDERSRAMRRWWVGAVAGMIGVGVAGSAPARGAAEYAPPDRPGPALTPPDAALRAALTCGPGVADATRSPVLLVAGTGGTPEENYSWNYQPAFTARGIPWCGITVPDHTLSDVQDQGQYIVSAIRTMHAISGQRVSILGYSQGGMTPRWALRFWPDTRAMVDDMISLAGDNHGTSPAQQACAIECPAAAWQNIPGSRLLDALNSPAETFAPISYTQIYTNLDELSTPAGPGGTSPLHTGTGAIANISLQDVCPASVADHVLIGTTDPVGWALVVDALDHPGPASAARIDSTPCTQLVLPGIDPAQAANAAASVPFLLAAATVVNLPGVKKLRAEPALRCYVFAACPGPAPSVLARLLGGLERVSLTLTAGMPDGAVSLAAIHLRLPDGLVFTKSARTRLRVHADGRARSSTRVAMSRRTLVLRGPSEGVRRWSVRAPAGTLALGPRLRARLAGGGAAVVRLRTTGRDDRSQDVSVSVRRRR